MAGKVSIQGYKKGSPDNRQRQLTIPGNRITMADVPYPVYASASNGQQQMMYPGGEYHFPGAQYVNEVPLKQQDMKKNTYKNGGMFWDGSKWVKTASGVAAGYQYQNGGQYLPMKVPSRYQLWQQGGQVDHPQTTHEHWLANQLQTNMNPELSARRAADSTWAAGQLQGNPNYVTAANHMYGQFINQNPKSPDVDGLRDKMSAYQAAQQAYQQHHKQYGGYKEPPENSYLPMKVPSQYQLWENGGMYQGDYDMYKKGGIYIKPSKRGTFTAAANKHGQSVQGFASQVLAHKENYSPAMVKKANFARNAAGWHHEMGGQVDNNPQYGGGHTPYLYGGQADADGDVDMMKSGGWIQKATAHMRTDHPCTGSKFGSSSCPPGSKRYNLAKTFKAMHHQNGGPVYQQGGMYGTNPIPADVTAGYNQTVQNSGYQPVMMDTTGQPMVTGNYANPQEQQVPNAPMQPTGWDNGYPKARRKRGFDYAGGFDSVLGAGLALGNFINGENNARSVHEQAQANGLSSNMIHMNQPGTHGDYSQQGYFRPDAMIPTRAGMYLPQQQMGGYTQGSTHDLTESQIAALKKAGYRLQYI